jgi:uroporphyrinogen decarboxylase
MKEEMKPKERAAAVFRGELPDRAPVCDFGNAAMLGHYGYMQKDVRGNPKLSGEIMSKWAKETYSDMVFGVIESKGIFMDIPDLKIKLPDNDQGSLINCYFETPEDIDSKPLFDPFNPKECPNFYKYVVSTFEGIKKACPDVATPAWCEGTLTTTGFLRGIENLLMDILIAPDDAKKVIARGAEFSRKIVEAQLEIIDTDYVICTDPVSSADMIDDNMFREFNLEPLKKNISSWKNKYGKDTMLHICGDTTPMLEDLVNTGARVMSMDHAVNLAEAKKAFKGRMAIMGNLDPVSVLLKGSASDVEKAAEKCFKDAGQGGGYIFGAGCAVPSGTPMENILKISEVSKRHPY